jgi:IS30 family transposase
MTPSRKQRIEHMAELIKRGWTHAEVADLFGYHTSTVATMCHKHRIRCSNAPDAIAKRNAIKASAVARAWADPKLRAQRIERMKIAALNRNSGLPPQV